MQTLVIPMCMINEAAIFLAVIVIVDLMHKIMQNQECLIEL